MGIDRVRELTIYITKAASFALLGVVKATSPVYGYVAFLSVQARSPLHTAACTDATELEQAVKDGAVIADIELRLLSLIVLHVLWADLLEEVDVLVGVKLGHF